MSNLTISLENLKILMKFYHLLETVKLQQLMFTFIIKLKDIPNIQDDLNHCTTCNKKII